MRTVQLPPNVGDKAYHRGTLGHLVARAKGSGKFVFVDGSGDAFVVAPEMVQSAMKVSGGAELVALRELGRVCLGFKAAMAPTGTLFGALPGERGEIIAYVRREADIPLLPRQFAGRPVKGIGPKKDSLETGESEDAGR